MSTSLTTRINASIARTFRSQPASTGPVFDDSNSWLFNDSWEYGSGTDQANLVYHAVETLSTGSSVLFDVYGTLRDGFGVLLSMSKVKILAVVHRGSAGTLTIGGGSNAMTSFWATAGDALKIQADGGVVLVAPDSTGYAVTSNTAENIRVLHNGDTPNDITFEILIVGVG